MNEYLESAKSLIGEAMTKDSAMVYALIAQAEIMQRLAVAMERQADALEAMTGCISENGLFLDVKCHPE